MAPPNLAKKCLPTHNDSLVPNPAESDAKGERGGRRGLHCTTLLGNLDIDGSNSVQNVELSVHLVPI